MTLLDADKIQRLEPFGEDTSDLLQVIQESFGIEFTTDELVASETVGQLSECISSKLARPQSDRCLSAIVFYTLRRAFTDLSISSQPKIRPDTRLDELLPWMERRSCWSELRAHLGLVLPDLTWPIWLLSLSVMISGLVVAWAYPRWIRPLSVAGLVAAVAGLLTWFLMLWLLSPLARAFPRSCVTFGDLVKFTLARNYATISQRVGGSSQTEVLLAVRHLIAVEIAKDVETVKPETRFPEGLNIY